LSKISHGLTVAQAFEDTFEKTSELSVFDEGFNTNPDCIWMQEPFHDQLSPVKVALMQYFQSFALLREGVIDTSTATQAKAHLLNTLKESRQNHISDAIELLNGAPHDPLKITPKDLEKIETILTELNESVPYIKREEECRTEKGEVNDSYLTPLFEKHARKLQRKIGPTPNPIRHPNHALHQAEEAPEVA
jgi:hypothetical protein